MFNRKYIFELLFFQCFSMVMPVFGEYFQVQIGLEKKRTPWDMKSTTTTFTGDACLYVQIANILLHSGLSFW